jgi:hypothetical protein
MALKGPSFSGPTKSGWSAASLVPQATVAATLPVPAVAPVQPSSTSDLSKYNLTPKELGIQPNLRVATPAATPLEQLLAQMFPDAAADFNPQEIDPLADPRAQNPKASLLGTILGNLAAQQPSAQPAPVSFQFSAPAGVPQIPGAPAFLPGTTANLMSNFSAPVVPAAGANPLNSLAAISAVAAEQRAQQAEQAKAQKEAETAYFQQQQQKQKAQSMVAQRQRQRFGAVNGTTSGWATNPVLF